MLRVSSVMCSHIYPTCALVGGERERFSFVNYPSILPMAGETKTHKCVHLRSLGWIECE